MSFIKTQLKRLYRRLFARPRFVRWNTVVLTLALNGLGILNYENATVSGEKYLLHACLPKVMPARPIVFDVGAYVGEYSREVMEVFPEAKVFAFEPHPKNRRKFLIRDDPRLLLYPFAVGRASGETTLFDRADSEGSSHASLYPEVISELHRQGVTSTSVTTITLDEFCDRFGIGRIDLLKVDVEGHEFAVLEGAEGLINSGRVRVIQFEFNEMNVVTRTYMRDFWRMLSGYDLFRLLPRGLVAVDPYPLLSELFGYQNIVAILRDGGNLSVDSP